MDDGNDNFEDLELAEFSVYCGVSHTKNLNGQFEELHIVSSEKDTAISYIDGVVRSVGEQRRILWCPILDVNIGGLETINQHSTEGCT
jgi:hypothetical protein